MDQALSLPDLPGAIVIAGETLADEVSALLSSAFSSAMRVLSVAVPGGDPSVHVEPASARSAQEVGAARARFASAQSATTSSVVPRRDYAAPYTHGLEAVLVDRRRVYAVIDLRREERDAPFSSEEVDALRRAMPMLTSWFALDRHEPSGAVEEPSAAIVCGESYVLVVDEELRVCGSSSREPVADPLLRAFVEPQNGRLPPALARTVRMLDLAAAQSPQRRVVARPVPNLFVRIFPLASEDGRRVVVVDRTERRSPLAAGAVRYALSPRELDVLDLLMAGETTPSIAAALNIAEPTARDHVKRLLLKTGARNRVEVVARFLGFRPFSG